MKQNIFLIIGVILLSFVIYYCSIKTYILLDNSDKKKDIVSTGGKMYYATDDTLLTPLAVPVPKRGVRNNIAPKYRDSARTVIWRNGGVLIPKDGTSQTPAILKKIKRLDLK